MNAKNVPADYSPVSSPPYHTTGDWLQLGVLAAVVIPVAVITLTQIRGLMQQPGIPEQLSRCGYSVEAARQGGPDYRIGDVRIEGNGVEGRIRTGNAALRVGRETPVVIDNVSGLEGAAATVANVGNVDGLLGYCGGNALGQ